MTEADAFRRILEIVSDQKKLEAHQEARDFPFDSIMQSKVFAYQKIEELLEPFSEGRNKPE